jgi:hypothetical protein
MKNIMRAGVVVMIALALLLGAVGGVRWAKRGGAAASLIANALMLTLSMGIVVQPPQQGVEQAQEEADKQNGESGEPLT